MHHEIFLSTSKKQELIDITDKISSIIKKSKIKNGICNVFAAHATAAIIINENYDPNICLDLIDELDKLIWYCEACNHQLHEASFEMKDIVNQLPVVIKEFMDSEDLRICDNCHAVMEKI